MITTAAVTVGTSLHSTLSALRQAPSGEAWRDALPDAGARQRLADAAQTLEQLRRAVERGAWERAGELLALLPPELPQWGAEAATLHALRHEPEMRNLERVVLLASDTAEGRSVVQVLESALGGWERLPVSTRVIADLDHASPARFKVEGLRNLVSALAQVTREVRPHQPVFVVSGGFKAQVALTTVVGQALGVPVAYRFELFPDTMWLPPLPVRLDMGVVAPVADLLRHGTFTEEQLRQRLGSPLTEANPSWAAVRALLTPHTGPAGQPLWGLSPMGQLVIEMLPAQE